MNLTAFARKHAAIALNHGPMTAFKMASQEAGLRAAEPIAARKATPIWADEWDVCLVLDATRYDMFREVVAEYEPVPLHPNLDSRYSVGSASMHWINETFAPPHTAAYSHAGYVTANPFSGKQPDRLPGLNDAVYPLRDLPIGYLDEVWRDAWPMDDTLATVDPRTVTRRGLYAYTNSNVSRIVLHYMQPHIPFRSRPDWMADWGGASTFGEPNDNLDTKDIWLQLRDGELEQGAVWDAYKDNLRWVLEEVRQWYELTDANILVTADHGNAMGEYGEYSHPPFSANPYLRKVPWVHVQGVGNNDIPRQMQIEPPEHPGRSGIDDQLAALGYK